MSVHPLPALVREGPMAIQGSAQAPEKLAPNALDLAPFWRFAERALAAIAILGLITLSSACASLKPYERGKLAHPTMLLGDMSRAGPAHVYAIHEGAVGGDSGAKGGCGCN
jgi:hypothetical protein